jgi:hypothetical protein
MIKGIEHQRKIDHNTILTFLLNVFDMKFHIIISKDTLYALRFIIAPFGVFILGNILFELLAFKFPELNLTLIEHFSENREFSSTISFQESKARLLWVTSVLIYFFICAVFATFIWHTLCRSMTKPTILLFISVALIFTISEVTYFVLVDPSKSPLATIFRFTFDSLQASGQYSENELNIVYITLSLINLIAILVVPFGILTASCIMHKNYRSSKKTLDEIRCQSKHIKELLAGGSAVMVVGIAHMQLWLNWPLSFLTDDNIRLQIGAVTLAVSQYWGVIYTLTMAAVYLPTTFSLTEQAKRIIQSGHNGGIEKNPERWLKENKMSLSLHDQIPQLVAVIAPMLFGSFGSMLGNIMPF